MHTKLPRYSSSTEINYKNTIKVYLRGKFELMNFSIKSTLFIIRSNVIIYYICG